MKTVRNKKLVAFHSGAVLLEALVAATILLAGIGILARSHYSLRKLWNDTRNVHLAHDELANQLDRLVSLPKADLIESLGRLQVSQEIAAVLPECHLEGQFIDDSLGARIQLRINWKRIGTATPIELTGWLHVSGRSSSTISAPEKGPSHAAKE